MTTPEKLVKAKVKKILEEVGAYWAMPMGSGYGNSGVPDFLVCLQGQFIGIECKANGNTPTALQERHLKLIEETGGIAFVVDECNIDSFSAAMQVYKGANRNG